MVEPGVKGPCPTGHYCPQATAWPIPCIAGQYQPVMKAYQASACLLCPAGSYCEKEGLAAATGTCDVGFYCLAGEKMARPDHTHCVAGQKCPAGSPIAISCPAGTYQSQAY